MSVKLHLLQSHFINGPVPTAGYRVGEGSVVGEESAALAALLRGGEPTAKPIDDDGS